MSSDPRRILAKRIADQARYKAKHPNCHQSPVKGKPCHERHNATIRRKRRLGVYPILVLVPPTKRTCPICNTVFMAKGPKKYCSEECSHQAKCRMDASRFHRFAKFVRGTYPELYEEYVALGGMAWTQRSK
jgi:hypothetical protein